MKYIRHRTSNTMNGVNGRITVLKNNITPTLSERTVENFQQKKIAAIFAIFTQTKQELLNSYRFLRHLRKSPRAQLPSSAHFRSA